MCSQPCHFANAVVTIAGLLACFHLCDAQEENLNLNGDLIDVAYQTQLLAWQDTVTAVDTNDFYEWVLIRINGAGGLDNADDFSPADTVVNVKAVNATTPDVEFYNAKDMSRFIFDQQNDKNSPEW